MREKLPGELIEKMMPVLSELAKLIGYGSNTDLDALQEILSRVGLDNNRKALDELKQWQKILVKVRNMPDDTDEREQAVAALEKRGVRSAPAELAVYHAAAKPLTCEPDTIDFGVLKAGEAANATLKVSGRLSDVKPQSKRLSVTLLRSKPTETLIKIMLHAGQAGEYLSDELILQGEGFEIGIPVTARWATIRVPEKAQGRTELSQLQDCPICKARGTHGEGSLFWNPYEKKYECLNNQCKAVGPSPDKLRRPF